MKSDLERRVKDLEIRLKELSRGRDQNKLNYVRMEMAIPTATIKAREKVGSVPGVYRLRTPIQCHLIATELDDSEENALQTLRAQRQVPVYGWWSNPTIAGPTLIGQLSNGVWVVIREDCF